MLRWFWKGYNVHDAIKNIAASWAEVKMMNINGVWEKLCPQFVHDFKGFPETLLKLYRLVLPVLGLQQRQLLSGVSAYFLNVKFPVVTCHVFTLYFLTYMFTVCSQFGCFKNRAILGVFVDLVLSGSLRPTCPSHLSVRSFYLYSLPITFNSYFPYFSQCPPSIPPNHTLCFLSSINK